jgi:ribosomal protein S12 methylthiotransferase
MASEPAVCRYLDMPLQHASDRILRAMRRERSAGALRQLVARIRARVPGIVLRTAFIVGFPGETDDDVRALSDFVAEMAFDHVGVFRYSHEEGTAAARLPDDVPRAEKERRWERVMAVQAAVSARRLAAQVGRSTEVLVEAVDERGGLVGRTRGQAPEIDGVVRLRGPAAPGTLVRARITGASTYDLEAIVLPDAVDTPSARP